MIMYCWLTIGFSFSAVCGGVCSHVSLDGCVMCHQVCGDQKTTLAVSPHLSTLLEV